MLDHPILLKEKVVTVNHPESELLISAIRYFAMLPNVFCDVAKCIFATLPVFCPINKCILPCFQMCFATLPNVFLKKKFQAGTRTLENNLFVPALKCFTSSFGYLLFNVAVG